MTRAAFLFPGQGAQAVGMGRAVVEARPATRERFEEAKAILGYDLLDICLNGPKERLDATDVSQPAIFVTSFAALEALRATEPDAEKDCIAAAGLSLGEYTALAFAGALTFVDGVRVVQKRGQAMQAAADATPSGMVSVLGLEQSQIEELVAEARSNEQLELANYLCPGNIVVSGSRAACDRLENLAEMKGGRTIRLAVAGAFHTCIMRPADQRLEEALASVPIKAPRVPVWSNVDARPHTEPSEIRNLLVRQVLNPVLWEQTLRGLLAEGVERFYEIGPGRVLAGLLKRINRKIECRNVPG
jgi:[acyl-carrier-protein] S-malonyltransferase